jgi:CDK-activating kinase assembly factor MAT1
MAPAQRLNGTANRAGSLPGYVTGARHLTLESDSDSDHDDTNDECPICHSTRYLRRDMRFLINPECYHKMCESCVDRIFSHGPHQCPVAGCRKVLRRNKFRAPTFDDLRMEREIDIRKRMARVFNRREDDFESLRAYNDYLDEVEDLTFNLVNGIDVPETEKKVTAYEDANQEAIVQNRKMEALELEEAKARHAYEQEKVRMSREAALEEEEEERRELANLRNNVISRLASGSGNATRIAREGEAALRKAGRKKEVATQKQALAGSALSFQGLRKKSKDTNEPEKPFDPFGGMSDSKEHVIMPDMLPDLWDEYLGPARKEARYMAGGYSLQDFYTRALCDLFGGLNVIVSEEKSAKPTKQTKDVVMADAFA